MNTVDEQILKEKEKENKEKEREKERNEERKNERNEKLTRMKKRGGSKRRNEVKERKNE